MTMSWREYYDCKRWSKQTAQVGRGDGEEERRARLEVMQLQMDQFGHGDGRRKKSKTGEDSSYHTAQVGPGDRGRKKREKKGLDLIWI